MLGQRSISFKQLVTIDSVIPSLSTSCAASERLSIPWNHGYSRIEPHMSELVPPPGPGVPSLVFIWLDRFASSWRRGMLSYGEDVGILKKLFNSMFQTINAILIVFSGSVTVKSHAIFDRWEPLSHIFGIVCFNYIFHHIFGLFKRK